MGTTVESRLEHAVWCYVPPVLLTLGTFGNVMTGVVLRRMRTRRSAMPVYLASLAVSDTFVLYTGLLRYWMNYVFQFDVKAVSAGSCKVMSWLIYSFLDVSAWILMSMTVERALSVWLPHRVSILCSRSTAIVIVVAVVVAFLAINCHILFGLDLVVSGADSGGGETNGGMFAQDNMFYADVTSPSGMTSYERNQTVTVSGWDTVMTSGDALYRGRSSNGTFLSRKLLDAHGSTHHLFAAVRTNETNVTSLSDNVTSVGSDAAAGLTAVCGIPSTAYRLFFDQQFVWLDLTAASLLPFAVLLTGNCLILVKVTQHLNERHALRCAGQPRDVTHRRKVASSMTVTLVTLSVFFFVTTLPICVYNIMEIYIINAFGDGPDTIAKLDLAWAIVNMLMYTNNAANFYLYCLTGNKFRAEFLRCLCCLLCCIKRASNQDIRLRVFRTNTGGRSHGANNTTSNRHRTSVSSLKSTSSCKQSRPNVRTTNNGTASNRSSNIRTSNNWTANNGTASNRSPNNRSPSNRTPNVRTLVHFRNAEHVCSGEATASDKSLLHTARGCRSCQWRSRTPSPAFSEDSAGSVNQDRDSGI